MTNSQLKEHLKYVNHSFENRKKYATMVMNGQISVDSVLDILFDVDNKISARAGWLLDFVTRENLNTILPYLDRITSEMHKVHLDSAVRPIAKVCEMLIEAYYGKKPSEVKNKLKAKHMDAIIECCFDYLITEQKIAPKAYAMNTLYLLGKDYDWIHPELALILQRDFEMQSSGFKARAKYILTKIKH